MSLIARLPRTASLSFWSFAWALIFECIGFVSLGIHSYSSTNHVAFLASFTAFNLTPVFLSIACFMVFDNLITRTIPVAQTSIRTICLPPHFVCPFLVIYELVAAGFIITGLFHEASFLSVQPIASIEGAAARLSHQSVGAAMLTIGIIIQLACFVLFAWTCTAILYTWTSSSADIGHAAVAQRRKVFMAVAAITALLTLSSLYKLMQYSGQIENDFPTGSMSSESRFPLFDASPQLLASFLFTTVFTEMLSPVEEETSTQNDRLRFLPEAVSNEKIALLSDV